jgi:uncharacterized membrane protein
LYSSDGHARLGLGTLYQHDVERVNGVRKMMILLFLAIGFAIYYFATSSQDGTRRTNHSSAVETLKLRYAKGEIDEETYLRTMVILNK